MAMTLDALSTQKRSELNDAYRAGLALGRKFEDQDVWQNSSLAWAANVFVGNYAGTNSFVRDMRAKQAKYKLSPAQLRGALNVMMTEAKATMVAKGDASVAAPASTALTLEDQGVYVMADGSIYKVKANKAKTNVYAMLWVEIGGQRLTEAGPKVNAEYQYAAGMAPTVASQGHKMTLDEAKAFMVRYGVCSRCSRQLKDAKSVEQAIGPVCVKYFGGYGA